MPSKFPPILALLTILVMLNIPDRHAVAAPKVVASIAPLHSLVAAVMAGRGAPRLLLRGGESPHTFSLRPSDARMLNDADILFWIGPPLELPLARILPNLGVSRAVSMLDSPAVKVLPNRHLHAADDPTPHDDHDAEDDDIDPHIWLSPANASLMTDEIARVLAQADPPQAELYRANAARLKDRLMTLDRDLAFQLAGIQGAYAVFHDAYQYFERHFGLQAAATITTHPERSPGAAHLRELRATLVERQVRCLFSEPQFQPRLVSMLSEGLPIRHAVLDPLGTDIPPGPDAYLQMMHSIAGTLTGCMQGENPQ